MGVASEARASCSGEHVVPCLPPCSSVTVCLKLCSFSRLVGFIFIPPPTAQQTSSPLLHLRFHLPTLRFLLRRSPGSPTARPRSLPRIGEGGRSSGRACVRRKVCEGESVSGPPLLILPTIPARRSVMTLEAIRYRAGSLQILNQLLLPHQTVYDDLRSVQDAYEAIKSMKVRGLHLLPLPTSPGPSVHASPRNACFSSPRGASFVLAHMLPYACRRAPDVGLLFGFDCTCLCPQILDDSPPLVETPI